MKPAMLGLAMVVWSAAWVCAAAELQPRRIEEAFAQDRFDKSLWTAQRVGARADPGGGQLTITFPKGRQGRPPAGLKARFRIEGDFDIRATYAIGPWRMPKKEWINLTILVEGPDGAATVIRTYHSQVGSGYSMWYGPSDSSRPGAWKQEATKDTSGWLRLKRSGGQVKFFVSGPGAADFRELGAVDYGTGPITGLSFTLTVPEMQTPVVAAFGKIEVEADRVIEPPRPPESMFGARFWLGAGVALAVAAGLGAWFWKRGRGPASRPARSGKTGRR